MGAGVHHGVAGVVMWQVRIRWVAVESELEHFHPWRADLFPHFLYLWGDESQVFHDHGHVAECLLHFLEEINARAFDPAAFLRRWHPCGYLPVRIEPPEVIQADDIHHPEDSLEPRYPPGVAVPRHRVPAVEWISPKLTGFAVQIWGNPGDHRRAQLIIQEEEVWVRPCVGAVVGDEDRDVADDLHATLACVPPQGAPLVEEDELDEFVFLDFLV